MTKLQKELKELRGKGVLSEVPEKLITLVYVLNKLNHYKINTSFFYHIDMEELKQLDPIEQHYILKPFDEGIDQFLKLTEEHSERGYLIN